MGALGYQKRSDAYPVGFYRFLDISASSQG